ncbi:hypothetical protein [Sphingomonas sp. G-3-2-10]|uniref:hypothetical protein n=1 Tax=Sphingomonas sp. G-3-2-10 TaxID=2728838 RepID=UPI00146D19AB|nr:hypothetical protein [Sphingomonas sp. G-3-2-10]NML05116.1 hypothetical protein [Sphingomonas sp. G-3-2-10]
MASLLPEEENALLTVVCRFNQLDFEAFLGMNGGPALSSFSSPLKSMMVIAIDFNGWVQRDGKDLPKLLDALATSAGSSVEVPMLVAAALRLRTVEARTRALGRPTDVRLAGGMPIINRMTLRQHLQDAIDGANDPGRDVKVVKVVGDRGLGRTYSWYLIKHVADSGVAKAIKVDLISATLQDQTLEVLFNTLVRNLGITDGRAPTSDGVTADTLAARYAEEFAGCLNRASGGWPKPLWLVFDSLDRELRPEVKRFVSLLATMRFEGGFDRCVIFLLGPDAITEPADPGRLVRNEPLVAFTPAEITEAATGLNGQGTTPLSEADLNDRIAVMHGLAGQHAGSALCREVCVKLIDLRVEVRA